MNREKRMRDKEVGMGEGKRKGGGNREKEERQIKKRKGMDRGK